MSKTDWLTQCLAMLERMPSSIDWGAADAQIYGTILRKLGQDLATEAVTHLMLTSTFRPAPAQIMTAAVQIAAPAPTVDDGIREIMHVVRRCSIYGVPDPARPSIRLEGDYAAWSHPVIADAVRAMGGSRAIASSTAPESVMRRQLTDALERAIERYRTSAVTALASGQADAVKSLPRYEGFDEDSWDARHGYGLPPLVALPSGRVDPELEEPTPMEIARIRRAVAQMIGDA